MPDYVVRWSDVYKIARLDMSQAYMQIIVMFIEDSKQYHSVVINVHRDKVFLFWSTEHGAAVLRVLMIAHHLDRVSNVKNRLLRIN